MSDVFTLATFGTSLTANSVSYATGHWQRVLERVLAPGKQSRIVAYNLGAGGTNSNYGLSKIGSVIRLRPHAITIEFQMNDCALSGGVMTGTSENNTRAMIDAIQAALPGVPIFLMTMNPPIGGAVSGRPDIEDYNDIYREIAGDTEGVDIIDMYSLWSDATGTDIPDGLHPTYAAHLPRTIPAVAAKIAPLIT